MQPKLYSHMEGVLVEIAWSVSRHDLNLRFFFTGSLSLDGTKDMGSGFGRGEASIDFPDMIPSMHIMKIKRCNEVCFRELFKFDS